VRLTATFEEVVTEAIAVGESVTGRLDDANPTDYYIFEGDSAELLRLTGSQTPGSQTYEVLIYTQDGFVTMGASTAYGPVLDSFEVDPVQLPQTGEYLAFVHRVDFQGRGGDLGATDYTFMLTPSETAFLQLGVEVTGSFEAEQYEQTYRYEGSAGQNVRITLRSLGELYAPAVGIQGPALPGEGELERYPSNFYANLNGNTAGVVIYETILPVDGAYIFRVGNGQYNPEGGAQGQFGLLIEAVN
jgi:hypothetical protein